MTNKFGFDPDNGIYCMSLNALARERREAAEAAAAAAAERQEAVQAVTTMIADAIEYLKNDIRYLSSSEISEQFYHSLAEVNNVPVDIIRDAANDYIGCNDCSDTIKYALQSLREMSSQA